MQCFPDPSLTASIYCTGGLDEVLYRVIAPFWRELRLQDPERLCSVWVMRYGRGGEHLKVRIHGPDRFIPCERKLLESRAEVFFASLPESATPPRKEVASGPPPIDAEDLVDGEHPDRSLLWTTYRRSHVSLGGKPFLDDDHYASLFTQCLAAGCELVLTQEGGLPLRQVRQRTLLKALIAGLGALGLPAEKRADYLTYHRDWLLRFAFPKDQGSELQPADQLRRRFDEQIAIQKDSFLPLWRAAAREWGKGERDGRPETGWRGNLVNLWEYVQPFSADPEYRLDPFASDPAFAPVFKAFHGLANQLGLRLIDEAFTHHLLLCSAQTTDGCLERAVS